VTRTASRVRRRSIALVVATAMGVLATIGLASAAQAAPEQPVIVGPAATTFGLPEITVDLVNDLNLTMTVSVDGVDDANCTNIDVTGLTTATCSVDVPTFGEHVLVATSTDGDGSTASEPFTITRGGSDDPVITSPPSSASVTGLSAGFSGTGPEMGTVDVRATPAAGGAEIAACSAVPVNAAGDWSCTATFDQYTNWNVWATAQDVLGNDTYPSITQAFRTDPDRPGLDVYPYFGTAEVVVTGMETADVSVTLRTDFGGANAFDSRCPVGWDGDYGNPPAEGNTVDCDFTLPAGIHLFSSVQFVNDVYSNDRGDLIRVPEAPVIVEAVPGPEQVTVSGTRLASVDGASTVNDGSVVAVEDGDGNLVCEDHSDTATAEWSCTGSIASGAQQLIAHAVSTGFADDTTIGGAQNGYHNGISALSAPVDVTIPAVPPAPVMSYAFGPASIGATATGDPAGGVAIWLYRDAGEGYWSIAAGCPGLEMGEGYYVPFGGPVESCTFEYLEPGVWNVYSNQEIDSVESEWVDDYVMIPETPTLGHTVNADRSVTFSGEGQTGYLVRVHDAGGTVRCQDEVDAGGTWSCTLAPAAGQSDWRATQRSQGFVADPGYPGTFGSFQGISAYTAAVAVTVPAAPAPTPTPTPTLTPTPIPWSLLGLDDLELEPGETVELGGSGLVPGSSVGAEIHSTPRVLGSTVVGADGSFTLPVTIPEDIEPGDHALVVTVTPPGGSPSTVSQSVVVVPAEAEKAAAASPPHEAATTEGGTGSTAGSGERSNPAAPSVLTDSVTNIRDVIANPITIAGAAGLGLALLLLVAFPAELLNSTLSANSRRLGRGFAAIEAGINRATAWFIAVTRAPAIAAAVIVIITSVIFGFVDPNFGFDIVSLRLVLSLAIGLFVVSYVASWISSSIVKRAWGVSASIELQPAALVFAILGVVLARALDFSPGFLIGLVIGLELATKTKEPYRSRATLVHLGVLASLSVMAWLLFSLLGANPPADPGFVELLAFDALAATTIEGLTAATVALLPLGFLEGRALFRHSRLTWAAAFAIMGTLFCLLVLPTASGESEVRDWLSWSLVLLGFAVVTLGLWAVFHFTGGKEAQADDEGGVSFEVADDEDDVRLEPADRP
jgi:hypothetical protein